MKQKLVLMMLAVFFLAGTGYAQVKRGKQDPRRVQVSTELGTLNNETQQATPVLRAPGDVIFSSGFEGTTGTSFPSGWTTNPSSGGTAGRTRWATGNGNISGSQLFAPHSGTRCAYIIYNSTAHDAWMATPAIALTAGTTYTISFWTLMVGDADYEELELWAAYSATAPTNSTLPTVMATGSKIWENKTEDYFSWTEINVLFTPSTTGNYYLGWHNTSTDQYYVAVDDISVSEARTNDLKIIASMPYTQIPTSQTFTASAKAKNIGIAAQTNITLAAELNSSNVGTSAAVASLASGATSAVLSIPSIAVPSGSNTLNYTISSAEGASAAANFNFTGSADTYAVDNATSGSLGSTSSALTMGNIFEITNATYMLKAIIGFGNDATMNYTISLYPMTGDLQAASTPLFTQAATRNATGLATVDVPVTALAPGRYFLCVKEPSASASMGLWYQSVPDKILYVLNPDFSLYDGNIGYAGAIRMVIGEPQTNDAAITAIIAPVSGDNLTAAEMVTATVANNGLNPITSVDLELTVDDVVVATETYTGNIASGASTNYTFSATANVSAAGDHTITVRAILAGDANAANDSKTVTIRNRVCNPISTYPFTENFDSYTGTAYNAAGILPDCWYAYAQSGKAAYTPHITNGSSFNYFHSSPNSVMFVSATGSDYGGENTYLVLPAFDKTLDQLKISFWYRYENVSYGTLTVGYLTGSQDNISSYTPLFTVPGTTTVTQKEYQFIDAGTDLSAATYIAFRYNRVGSWYSAGIDDINVNMVVANDAEITAITAPVSGNDLTATETVTATIKNNGTNPITSMNLGLKVDGGAEVIESYTGNIAAGTTANYTFSATANLSAAGDHTITVRAILAGDADAANDSKTVIVKNIVCNTISTYPFTEGFEDYTGTTPTTTGIVPACWYAAGTGTGSNLNTPHITGSGSYGWYPHSGSKALSFTGHSTDYNGSNGYVVLPAFDKALDQLKISFWYKYESASSGTLTVGYITGSQNNVSSYVPLFTVPATTTITQIEYAFENAGVDLSAATHIAFRWNFVGTTYYTAAIDDINVDENQSSNVQGNSFENIKVYPNPTSDNVVIENAAGSRIKIYDISGKAVFDSNINNAVQTLDISNIAAGVYFVELQNQTSKSTVKLIKK